MGVFLMSEFRRHSSYSGATVACFSSRDYNPFTDKKTGEQRPGGTIRHVHLVVAVDAAPISARVRDEALFEKICGSLVGEKVDVVLETSAQNGRFQDEIVQCAPSGGVRRKSA